MRLSVSLVDHNSLAKPLRFMCFFVSLTSLSFYIIASAKTEERTDKIDPITKKNDERSIELSSYVPKIQILSKDWGNGHPDDIKRFWRVRRVSYLGTEYNFLILLSWLGILPTVLLFFINEGIKVNIS